MGAEYNQRNVIEFLLNKFDDIIDDVDNDGRTALHHAALNNATESVMVERILYHYVS